MYTHANKTPKNRNNATANNSPKLQRADNTTFQFVDNRPETFLQRNLMQMANPSTEEPLLIQKKAALEEEELLQGKFEPIQKQALEEEELQMKTTPFQKKDNNTGLPDNLKSGIENLSGYSMDDVKVHYNSDQPAQLNAHAYAQGTDIHLASGQEKHLPHEAWHVVQQKQGRVKPTLQMKGKVNVNDNSELEKEADVMGAKALQNKTNWVSEKVRPVVRPKGKNPKAPRLLSGEVVQRSIGLVSTENNTWDLALKRANRDETSGFTPPVVNGTEYAPGVGGNWVNDNLLSPTITTVQGKDGIYRARAKTVPANAVGYNMYLPAPPGPWQAVADKGYILGYYGIHPLEGTGNVNLQVVGHPDNSTFLQKVKAHEGVHANDINRAINAILGPWDNALQQCMRDGTEFPRPTQVEAENALWEAVGGNPLQITGRLDEQWTADNNAYHRSHEGGSNVQSATYDAETNTVTLSVMINQPLPEGSNWLMLGTVVVLALALVGGLVAKNLLGANDG